jgi:ferredoxin
VLKVRVQAVNVDVLLHPGDRLLDVVDELSEPPLDFPCRDASCGRCAVEVLHGAALLRPASAEERHVLCAVHADARLRLGCQVRAGDREGEVVLTPRRDARPG